MNEQTIQTEYVDTMLRLAFRMEADDATRDILNRPDQKWTPEEDAAAEQALQKAWRITDQHSKEAAAAARKKRISRMMRQAGKAAACIIIALALAFPVALAASAEFRSYVMKLMMVWDQTNGEAHFSFVKQEDESFAVPEEWTGEWYPSFIPDDMELIRVEGEIIYLAVYSSTTTKKLFYFYEMDANCNSMIGTDDAIITELVINGQPAWLLVQEGPDDPPVRASIVWSGTDKWFDIDAFYMDANELLQIAESVKKVVR